MIAASPASPTSSTGGPPASSLRADEVDQVISGWSSVRPDLDLAPLRVLSRVTRLARHLDRARRAAFARHGLEPWEFDVLAALRRSGPPYQLSPGRLMKETMVTSGTMTNRVDRLTQRELTQREADPSDRRGVIVSLTPAGQLCVDAAMAELLTAEQEMLAGLSNADVDTLATQLRALLSAYTPDAEDGRV